MMNMGGTDLSEEEKFSIVVLHNAKSILGEKSEYLRSTRMTKLVFYISQLIDFNLTRGWYKFGAYSPTAFKISKKYLEEENLASFNPPQDVLKDAKTSLKDEIKEINSYLKRTSYKFRRGGEKFYKWIYENLAPLFVRDIYKSHRSLEKSFSDIFLKFDKLESDKFEADFNKEYRDIEEKITIYNRNLDHIKDNEILDLFFEFTDLLELGMLKVKNSEPESGGKTERFFKRLKDIYCSENPDIWLTIVPYKDTVTGPKAEEEKEKQKRRNKLI